MVRWVADEPKKEDEGVSDEVEQVMEVANPAERAAAGVDPALARWRGFSDEDLQVIADRLAADLLAPDPSKRAKDRARLIDEINSVQNQREAERPTYRGPGRYLSIVGPTYEVLGALGDLVIVRDPTGAPGALVSVTRRSFEARGEGGKRLYEYLGPLEGSPS